MHVESRDAMQEKTIAYVGGSDEDVARLRLTLRKAQPALSCSWRFATEEAADVLVVDARTLVGQMARTRAGERGRRCVVLDEVQATGLGAGEIALVLPYDAARVAAVFNAAAEPVVRLAKPIISHADDSFFADAYDTGPIDFDPSELPEMVEHDGPAARPPPGWDESEALFRRDPTSQTPQVLIPGRLDPNTGVEYTPEVSERAAARIADRAAGAVPFDASGAPNIDPALRRRPPPDRTPHALSVYCRDELLLGGPARCVRDGAPALVLDPKAQVYHAELDLDALEPYVREEIRRCDWEPLTSAELAEVRARLPGKPNARLVFLETLLGAGGRLAPHLDPGGTYRLLRWFEIAHAYPRYWRISAAMLRPQRLHDIAASSGAPMADVFDLVTAYDAIGYLERTARERLRPPDS